MGTLRDFWNKNVVGDGAMGDMVRAGQKKAAAGLDYVSSGLRTAGAKIAGSPVGQPVADIAEGVGNQARAAGQAAVDATAQGLRQTAAQVNPGAAEYRSWGPTPDERALTAEYGPELTPTEPAAAAQPSAAQAKFGPQGSPEAQAWRASQAGGAGTPPGEPPAGAAAGEAAAPRGAGYRAGKFVGGGLRTLASRVVAPIALGRSLGEYEDTTRPDIDSSAAGTAGYLAHGEFGKAGSSLYKGAKEAYGDVGRGVMKTVDDAAGLVGAHPDWAGRFDKGLQEQGTGLALRKPAVLASAGGATPGSSYTGDASSDPADKAEGPPTSGAVAAAPAAAQGSQAGIPTTQGLRVSPEQLVSGSDVPKPGYGAFKVGSQRAVQLGSDAPKPQAAPTGTKVPEDESKKTGVRSDTFYRQLAAAQGERVAAKTREQDIQMANNRAQLEFRQKELNHTLGNENRKNMETATTNYVKSRMEAASPGLFSTTDAPKREAAKAEAEQKVAAHMDSVDHTLSNHGQTWEQLSSQNHRQMLQGLDFKDKLEKARSTGLAWAKDFFGTGRFDSKDAYSYLPARAQDGKTVLPAERDVAGGLYVKMGNGNRIRVYRDAAGGGFNFTGPNDPVDSDAMAMIKPAIAALEAKERKGKK